MIKIMMFLSVLFQLSAIAQTNYLMKLSNPNQIDSNNLEFDIIINSTDTDFLLSSYQCSFSFDLNMTQNDSIWLKYRENSSELDNFPLNIVGHDSTDGINELIFVSGIGNDLISPDDKLVGRFKIYSTVDFTVENLKLSWNFTGSANTILTGENFSDITDSLNFKNFDASVTDITKSEEIPHHFELSQNYPNPFNPSTKISFALPEKGIVTLTIYNIIGAKVMDLLNRTFNEGMHTVEVDGSQLPSGVYVYKLNVAGKYSAIKKMILLK